MYNQKTSAIIEEIIFLDKELKNLKIKNGFDALNQNISNIDTDLKHNRINLDAILECIDISSTSKELIIKYTDSVGEFFNMFIEEIVFKIDKFDNLDQFLNHTYLFFSDGKIKDRFFSEQYFTFSEGTDLLLENYLAYKLEEILNNTISKCFAYAYSGNLHRDKFGEEFDTREDLILFFGLKIADIGSHVPEHSYTILKKTDFVYSKLPKNDTDMVAINSVFPDKEMIVVKVVRNVPHTNTKIDQNKIDCENLLNALVKNNEKKVILFETCRGRITRI